MNECRSWRENPHEVADSRCTRFTRPVAVPDDGVGASVEVTGVVAARDEQARTVRVDLTALSQGQKVLGKAQVQVRLPR